MEHADHTALISGGVRGPGTWLELGAGRGAFTLALADLLSGQAGESRIIALDRDRPALKLLQGAVASRFPQVPVEVRAVDFTTRIDLPPLDGVLAANSLHFVYEKLPVLQRIHALMKPGTPFIVVEYDVDQGNIWVPHPFSLQSWRELAHRGGFVRVEHLADRPSRFLKRIYAAAAWKAQEV